MTETEVKDAWPRGIYAITLFVEDLETTKKFYQEVFGLPIHYEDDDFNSAVFMFGDTMVNLLKISQANELIEPAKVANREAGSRFAFTIHVDDVDAKCAELTARGVKLLERSDGPALGDTHCQFYGSRRIYLGNCQVGGKV